MSFLPCSPAAPPLDDDNLLSEILLRLPPQPSSLPRASLVCKRWRLLVSDPGFTHRFRLHHRRNPSLLGCFFRKSSGLSLSFVPTMEAPNRVPPRRFSLPFDDDRFILVHSHHGLVLFFHAPWSQFLVWDPITGDQHRIDVPARFDKRIIHGAVRKRIIHGAVLRTAGDVQHFQVVLTVADDFDNKGVLACIYSSETGVWGDVVSMPIPPNTPTFSHPIIALKRKPARLIGSCLYWLLAGNFVGFLEFDLERLNLTMIPVPLDLYAEGKNSDFFVMRAEGGGLALFFLSDFTAQIWKRTTNGNGVTSWVLRRTIELDKLLSLNSEEKILHPWILGYAEDNNVVFLGTFIGVFMIHLKPLKFKKLPDPNINSLYHSFHSVYAAEACVSGGHDGAGVLLNTSTG